MQQFADYNEPTPGFRRANPASRLFLAAALGFASGTTFHWLVLKLWEPAIEEARAHASYAIFKHGYVSAFTAADRAGYSPADGTGRDLFEAIRPDVCPKRPATLADEICREHAPQLLPSSAPIP